MVLMLGQGCSELYGTFLAVEESLQSFVSCSVVRFALISYVFIYTHSPALFCSSWPEPCRAPAVVEGRDRRRQSRHGGQRHQTQQQWHWHRRGWRRFRPLHQQLFFNYLLLQSRQSVAAHLPPFHRQRTVSRPQPQKREGKGKGAREVK